MSKTDSESKSKEKEPDPKKMVGCGFDEQGFFRLMIHEDSGSVMILGFLVQAIDIIKAHFIQKAQQRAHSGIIQPGIHKAQKGLRPH